MNTTDICCDKELGCDADVGLQLIIKWKGWVTLFTLLVGFVLLIRDVMGPDFVMMGMLGVVMSLQIVDVKTALDGFRNEGLMTVVVLFVVAAGINQTGGLDFALGKLLGNNNSLLVSLLRMLVPVAIISAFLNNTPVVAIMIPIVSSWCSKTGIAPGQVFIPLSFASILGGTLTLIGTSTNLVVAGFLKDATKKSMGTFDLAKVGLPVAVSGLIYMLLFASRLLPGGAKSKVKRNESSTHLPDNFVIGVEVLPSSPVVDQTIEGAHLRGLDGLYLSSVSRQGTIIHAVGPEFVIVAHDVLYFTGLVEKVVDLLVPYQFRLITEENEENYEEKLITALLGSPKVQKQVAQQQSGYTAVQSPKRSSAFTTPSLQSQHSANESTTPQEEDKPLVQRKQGQTLASRSQSDVHDIAHAHGRSLARFSYRKSIDKSPQVAQQQDGGQCSMGVQMSDVRVNMERVSHRRPRGGGEGMQMPMGSLWQATVKEEGALVNNSIRSVGFRSVYKAAVVSVQRNGAVVGGKLGEIVLQPADLLLMSAAEEFNALDPVVTEALEGIQPATRRPEREFSVAMEVPNRSRLVGKTVEAAGLRGLPFIFLVTIERADGSVVHAVGPKEVLQVGDVLWFAGAVESIADLRKIPGLRLYSQQSDKLKARRVDRRLVQVVIAGRAPMVGKKIRDMRFRSNFDAAIIAVHRQGSRVRAQIGDIALHAGDVLLLDTGPNFIVNHKGDRNFALVAELENSSPPKFDKLAISLIAAAVMIVLATFQLDDKGTPVLALVPGGIVASGVMLASGCMSGLQARSAIKWDVYITIACAFGLSNAMEQSCAAKQIAELLLKGGEALGSSNVYILIAVYVATVLLSNVVANNAAAALMFPISFSVAQRRNIPQDQMSYLLMLAASACFASPFGYQTNLMVYGAGGYTTMDFIKFGVPMQLWQGVASIVVILYYERWQYVWIVSGVAMAIVLAWESIVGLIKPRIKKFSKS